MKKEKLKPCPLCGSVVEDKAYGIECPNCGLWLKASSRDFWNKRAIYDIQELDEMVKEYEKRKMS